MHDKVKELHDSCKLLAKLKSQLINELPHFGHEALFFINDEISTGILNNTTEIKIHLLTGQLIYSYNEENYIVDFKRDKISDSAHGHDYDARNITRRLQEIASRFNLKMPSIEVGVISEEQLSLYHAFAIKARRSLELFRVTLEGSFTQVHLWPDGFDFSVEWFTQSAGPEQIGIGISPGEEQYKSPYLYVNPYPFNNKVTGLQLPIGAWHTSSSGWNGIKVGWEDIERYPEQKIAGTIEELFSIAKRNFLQLQPTD
jgi:hypothetical protein